MTFDMMTLMKQGRSFSGRVVAFLLQVGAIEALKTMAQIKWNYNGQSNSKLFENIGPNHLFMAILPWSIGNVAILIAMPPLRTKPFDI